MRWRQKQGKKEVKNYGYDIAIIVTVLMVLQTVIFYSFFSRQMLREFDNTVLAYSSQQIASDDTMMYNIYSFVAMLKNDTGALRLMQEPIASYEESGEILQQLKRHIEYNDKILDCYLYNSTWQTLYSMENHRMPIESFNEKLAGILREKHSLTPRILVYSDTENYKITNNLFLIYNSRGQDAIIVKLNYQNLQKSYTEWQSVIKGRLIVATKNGQVIYGGDYSLGEFISDEEIFLNATGTKAEVRKINGEKSIVWYFPDSTEYLTYIMITPYRNIITNQFLWSNYVFVIISIIVCLCGIAYTVMLPKRLRRLLLRMKKNRESRADNEENKKYALLNYLMRMENAEQMDVRNYLPTDLHEKKSMAVLIVRLEPVTGDDFSDWEGDYDLLRYGTENICRELFMASGFRLEYVNETRGRMEYLVAEIDESSSADMKAVCKKAMDAIYDYAQIKSSYFYSSFDDIQNLQQSYKIAQEIEHYIFLYGSGVILSEEVIRFLDENLTMEFEKQCESLKDLISRREEVKETHLDELFALLRQMNITQVHDNLWKLMFTIYDITRVLKQEQGINLMYDTMPSGLSLWGQMSSLSEVEGYVHGLFAHIGERRKDIHLDKSEMMIRRCVEMIEENFSDPNFCIETMANQIGVSVNYLGRQFKRVTGRSIIDKITSKRLEEAQRLLLETDDSIKQVAKRVGFFDNNYFTLVFKKKYGMPPTGYRRIKQSETKK